MKSIIYNFLFFLAITAWGQENKSDLPYYEIPEASPEFTAGTVAARLIDGLGFRYYWATDGLNEKDLDYRPNEDARSITETLDHIYALSDIIVNSALKKPNISGGEQKEMTFIEKRERTLYNFKMTADILRLSDDISQFKIIFKSNDAEHEFPFWNQINGPISDALWHCGQVVLMRRSSGNPFNSKVSVFNGKVKE